MGGEHKRYLYGDSASLEVGFDVLDMLRGLVDCMLALGTAYSEIGALRDGFEESLRRGEAIAADLDRFGDEARIGLGASGRQSSRSEVHAFADAMVAQVESSIATWKEEQRHRVQKERSALDKAVRDHHRTMREALHALLLERELEVQSWAFEARVEGEALSSRLDWALPGDVRVAYELEPPAGWSAPFRLGDLVAAFELEVGFKKKLLRREPAPHRVDLSDHFIIDVRCVPTGARLSLARKLSESHERVDLELRLELDGVDGVVHDAAGGFSPKATATDDLPQLRKLWSALYERIGEPGRYRRRVEGIWLAERAVEDADALLTVVERFVAHARPIVRELALHSPNAAELSVKVDLGEGRREEIYVEREALQGKLLALPRPMLERLAFPQLLPPGTLDHDDSLIDLSDIVEADGGDSAVTMVSRLYPDAADRTHPGVGSPEVPILGDDSSSLDLTELATEADDELVVEEPVPGLRDAKG